MTLPSFTKVLLKAKKEKKLSFEDLGKLINRDEVWVASLFYGQATASQGEANILINALDLQSEIEDQLTTPPVKGCLDPVVPTDPLIYRFYEIMQVYGLPMKDVIQEKFVDGIMSAIDFSIEVDKVEDPKGDRVLVKMCGKFLPYKKW